MVEYKIEWRIIMFNNLLSLCLEMRLSRNMLDLKKTQRGKIRLDQMYNSVYNFFLQINVLLT